MWMRKLDSQFFSTYTLSWVPSTRRVRRPGAMRVTCTASTRSPLRTPDHEVVGQGVSRLPWRGDLVVGVGAQLHALLAEEEPVLVETSVEELHRHAFDGRRRGVRHPHRRLAVFEKEGLGGDEDRVGQGHVEIAVVGGRRAEGDLLGDGVGDVVLVDGGDGPPL